MKLKRRIGLEFGLALGILAVAGLASYRSLIGLMNTLDSLTRSYETLGKLDSLRSRVATAESAVRGYLLTGSNEYYQVYSSADKIVRESTDDLKQSMGRDEEQQAFFRDLENSIAARMELLHQVAELRRRSGVLNQEQAGLVARSGEVMTQVNRAVDEIRLKEIRLLAVREEEARGGTHQTILTLGAAFLVSFLLLISVFYLLTGEVQQRQEREEEIRRFSVALEQRNREAERATRLKSQFLASMSHELRTPLNAIIGFSDLLVEDSGGSLTDKQKRHLEHIRTAGRHLLQLINDILDLSKIETGQMTLRIENLAIAEVLPEVLSTISPLAMRKKITIENDVSSNLHLNADRVRLKQCLYNLLSNAVKFTPEGGRVRVAAAHRGEVIELSVADTGVGIRPEDHELIFEEFRQAGETTKGVKEGTGLGLAITKRLVEQQRGTIRVESELGRGAKFIFALPSAPQPAEPVRQAAGGTAVRSGRALVLVVDDEPVARELLVSYLAVEGYRTATAASGQEAISKVQELHPDVITLDLLMPGKSGRETLADLKSQPETASIPIVVVTVVDQKERAIALGAAEYLLKPVRREVLLDAIQKQVRPGPGLSPAVLVVDDDTNVQQMLAETLEAEGYSAIVAGSGREALDVLWHTRVQAIVLDLIMPEMDGFEVIRRVRHNPRLHHIPFFVLTAKDLTESDVQLLAHETRGYYQKDADWKRELLEQIRQVLGEPTALS